MPRLGQKTGNTAPVGVNDFPIPCLILVHVVGWMGLLEAREIDRRNRYLADWGDLVTRLFGASAHNVNPRGSD